MREGFEQILHEYGDSAKKLMDETRPDDELRQVKSELKSHRKAVAFEEGTSKEAQIEIVALQKQKQKIMLRLQNQIKDLDDSEFRTEQESGSSLVTYENNELIVQGKNGQSEAISVGELMTDGDWGLDYSLDSETVPRAVRKQFAVESAKRELRQLLDRQIILHESEREDTHVYKRETYQRIREDKEIGREHAGLIAEQMVRNYLKKLTFDAEVDFEIVETDVHQDVEQKLDFVVHIKKSHKRGVQVEAGAKENVGIQFTINTEQETQEKKKKQIEQAKRYNQDEAVDDIILVTVPMKQVMRQYRNWSRSKDAGGPDKLWDNKTKKLIFNQVLKGVMDESDIQEQWVKIEASFDTEAAVA
ncbi:MAG: hypothetical protein V1853_04915 [bacterium]